MPSIVYPNGSQQISIPASGKIAIYSDSSANLYKLVQTVNHPDSWDLVSGIVGGTEYVSSAFSAATTVRIDAGAAKVYYDVGATPVVGYIRSEQYQGTPGVLNATGTLTSAMIQSGIVTSTTAAGVTATLDTGAVMDASATWAIGDSFDWSAISTGANTFTVTAAASGHTLVGSGAVATVTSGRFRTRKTAAETFVTYRLS